MKYLFEDKEDDNLSVLFRQSLPENLQKMIEYSNGNGYLVSKSEELLKTGEMVVVILDTVPANKSIRDIYISLRRLSKQYEYRLAVWNIICAEYYFIKCFGKSSDLSAFENDIDFEIVVDVLPYKGSKIIQTEDDKAFTKTFEKFCKLYIMKNGGQCIYPESYFFENDCICDTECIKETLVNKSEAYRKAYGFLFIENDDIDVIWNIHRQLLQITNRAIEKYNQAGYLNVKAYPAIM